MPSPSVAAPLAPSLELRAAVADLYAEYGDVLDGGDLDAWPELFTDPCLYLVQPRENHDAGLPLATTRCESRGMLKDRAYAVQKTQMYAPRYLRHVISLPRIMAVTAERIAARANYAVFETALDEPTRILNVGRSLDLIVEDGGRLRFRERICVFDSGLVPTSLIYPV